MTPDNLQIFERITGRTVPPSLLPGEVSMPTQQRSERTQAFTRLLANPDFALWLEFARERTFNAVKGCRSDNAPDVKLRATKAVHEVVDELGEVTIQYVETTEQILKDREEWLKKEHARGGAPPPDQRTNV